MSFLSTKPESVGLDCPGFERGQETRGKTQFCPWPLFPTGHLVGQFSLCTIMVPTFGQPGDRLFCGCDTDLSS